jgi:hypothetical protein
MQLAAGTPPGQPIWRSALHPEGAFIAQFAGRRGNLYSEGEGEDGDVVFLSEVLGAAGDFLGVEEGELGKAVEAVEFAGGGAGFGDAVGEEDEGLAGG